jgi:hypothetical protein
MKTMMNRMCITQPLARRRRRRIAFGIFAGLLTIFSCGVTFARSQAPTRAATLAECRFALDADEEVALEIVARAPGAAWERKGAEAAALTVEVDGEYSQDVLLFAGDEAFTYSAHLGRLARGAHRVAVSLNEARSAFRARRAEITSLRAIPLLKGRAAADALALKYSPILYARADAIDRFTDAPLLMYYEIVSENDDATIVRYTVIFTNEDAGTPTVALMARWGRATDIEWVYQISARAGEITEEIFQGVEHQAKPFTGKRALGSHPLLAVASDNNNFSDLAASAVRFALVPTRADLRAATRESVMDAHPWIYRVMAEELAREGKISKRQPAAPNFGDDACSRLNIIADPRRYLYIEVYAEQSGAALGLAVTLADAKERFYRSDFGEARLRIDRSGYFRTAVLLSSDFNAEKLPQVETISLTCGATERPEKERACRRARVMRAFALDDAYTPREAALPAHAPRTLAPGETMELKLR